MYIKSFTTFINESMDNDNKIEGHRHKISDIQKIKDFIFAGKAIFTIESQDSGVWYTYQMNQAKKNENLFFVSVLRGADNLSSYSYMGLVIKEGENFKFTLTKNSKYKIDAVCVKAFSFFFTNITRNFIHPKMNFYHMGICGKCGRVLTTPDSVDRGIGPVCAKSVISEEEEINMDRKNKLVKMRKEWNYDDVKAKRKLG